MFVVPCLEPITSEPSVAIHCTVVVPPDSSSIHHTGCGTPPWYWTGCPPVHLAVAALFRGVVVVILENLEVVLVYVVLEVWHAPVAHFDGVLVENLVKWVVGWKVVPDDS